MNQINAILRKCYYAGAEDPDLHADFRDAVKPFERQIKTILLDMVGDDEVLRDKVGKL